MSFEGKVALVTGASRALAAQLLKHSLPVARKLSVLQPAKAVRRPLAITWVQMVKV